jgi:hypothetical protein
VFRCRPSAQLEVQTDVNIIEFTEEEQATIMDAFPVSEFMINADTYETLKPTRGRCRCGTSPSPIATCRRASSTPSWTW